MADLIAVILAAGKGTRMKSALPKVLHQVGGKPMVQHVIDAAKQAGAESSIVVVGFEAEQVIEAIQNKAEYVLQQEQLGTGHAVLQAQERLKNFSGTIMLLCGDTPLLKAETLARLYQMHVTSAAKATILSAVIPDPNGYGRIIRDATGQVMSIVEQKDATEDELAVCEVNTGIYCFAATELFRVLATVGRDNKQGEYYLTDVIAKLVMGGQTVAAIAVEDSDETLGINSRVQLAQAEKIFRSRKLVELMDNGVTIMDPASTFVDVEVTIGSDTVLYPFTWLEGTTVIGSGSSIGPHTRLQNTTVGNNTVMHFTYAHDCNVGDEVNVGPYVHLRPNTVLSSGVKVGNFVEVKNSNIGENSKLPHLSYIGDTDMGAGVNIGCGTITVNYDGKQKHRTVIEDKAFVGCNSNLVAPVTVGETAYVAAGSTITKEVPAGALGVARARQKNIAEWVIKYKE